MKRFLTIASTFLVLSFIIPVNNAHAITVGFIDLFTVNSAVSTTPQDIFNPGENPYLYMKLGLPDGAAANTLSGWIDPDGLEFSSAPEFGTSTQRWASLSNWSSVEKTGTWTINANYFDSKGNNLVASTDFTVTPEPATISLLLMGGIPLFFKRKKFISNSKTNS